MIKMSGRRRRRRRRLRWMATSGGGKWVPLISLLWCLIKLVARVQAKGLVGKLPGNPASCPEEPCNSDPQHVLRALKHTSYFVGFIFLMPILLYYMSKLFSKVSELCGCQTIANTKSNSQKIANLEASNSSQRASMSDGKKTATTTTKEKKTIECGDDDELANSEALQEADTKRLSTITMERKKSSINSQNSNNFNYQQPIVVSGQDTPTQLSSLSPNLTTRVSAPTTSTTTTSTRHNYNQNMRQQQHRYSMFIGAPPASNHLGVDYPNALLFNRQAQEERHLLHLPQDQIDSQRRSSLRRQRQVNGKSPDFAALASSCSSSVASLSKKQERQQHKVWPEMGYTADMGGENDALMWSFYARQNNQNANGREKKYENENDQTNRPGQLEVPQLGPQHRHSVDGSILNNMLAMAGQRGSSFATNEQAQQSANLLDQFQLNYVMMANESNRTSGIGHVNGNNNDANGSTTKTSALEGATTNCATTWSRGGREAKRREQLELFQAHRRQLAQLQRLQVSSLLEQQRNDCDHNNNDQRQSQNENEHLRRNSMTRKQRQQRRQTNGAVGQQLALDQVQVSPAAGHSSQQQQQQQHCSYQQSHQQRANNNNGAK